MARQIIDTTTPQPGGKMGDTAKVAFEKTNGNFEELYDAVANIPEDTTGDIEALDTRVTANEGAISALDTRVTANEGAIITLDTRVTANEGEIGALDTRVTANEGEIGALRGYIDGLRMEWLSGTSLRVTGGAAYVPGLQGILGVESPITKSSLSLSANTWYHLYLYSNGGSADIEISTTEPASPYSGTARTKSGDNTRRYIGSIRTGASNQILRFTHDMSSQSINYVVDLNTPPLLLVSNGTTANGSTGVAVSCASAVPVTARRLLAFFENTGSNLVFISIPELGAPNGNILSFLRPGAMVNGFIVINDNKEFSYSTGAGASFQCFCAGYTYER